MSELRESLQVCTDENADALRKKIDALRKELPANRVKSLSYKSLQKQLGLSISESEFSRYIKGARQKLDAREHHALVNFLFQHHFWAERQQSPVLLSIKDYAFHALVLYLNIGTATQDNMAVRASGRYRLYRPSAHRPGHYVQRS